MLVRLPTVNRLALGVSFLFMLLTGLHRPPANKRRRPVGLQGVEHYRPMIAIDGVRSVLPEGFKSNAYGSLDEVARQPE